MTKLKLEKIDTSKALEPRKILALLKYFDIKIVDIAKECDCSTRTVKDVIYGKRILKNILGTKIRMVICDWMNMEFKDVWGYDEKRYYLRYIIYTPLPHLKKKGRKPPNFKRKTPRTRRKNS